MKNYGKARGGGAIYFYYNDKKSRTGLDTLKSERFLNTRQCCFFSDSSQLTGSTFRHGPDHEILFEGYTKWFSFEDSIDKFKNEDYVEGEQSNFVSRSTKGFVNTTGFQVYSYQGGKNVLQKNICQLVKDLYPGNAATTINNGEEATLEYATIKNTGDGKLSNIPDPTTFVYQQTAITRLPQMTSSSYNSFPSAKIVIDFKPKTFSIPIFNNKPLHTIRRTPAMIETPVNTPMEMANSWKILAIEGGMNKSSKIGLIVSSLLALIGLRILVASNVYHFYFKENDDEEESTVEMDQETIFTAETHDLGMTTTENPLWTNVVVDDPFADEFEDKPVEKL